MRKFLSWVALCAFAEFFGIAAAALWFGGMHFLLGEPEPIPARIIAWIAMAMAGVPEGVVLGGLQAAGIKWFLPSLSAWRFMLATIAVGFLGWGIGTFIPMFLAGDAATDASPESGLVAMILYAMVFGIFVGVIFGFAQSTTLPTARRAKHSWIIANAFGWAFGLPLIFAAASLAGDYESWAVRIALWAFGGLGAGASVGIATGIALHSFDRTELSPDDAAHMVGTERQIGEEAT